MSKTVPFLCGVVSILVPININETSRSGILSLFSNSYISWIYLWKEFKHIKTTFLYIYKCIIDIPSLMRMVLSIGIILVSNSIIKRTVRTSPIRELMTIPSLCWYMSPPKQKRTFLVSSNNKLRVHTDWCLDLFPMLYFD